MRKKYEIAALISAFWQDNLDLLSDDLISQFYGMSTEQIISALMKDSRYFSSLEGIQLLAMQRMYQTHLDGNG